MRRVARDQVRMQIAIALTVLKPYQRRAVGIDNDRVREWLADELTSRVMGRAENEAVLIVPSRVPEREGERPGRWHEDEPHPETIYPLTSPVPVPPSSS